MNFLKTISFTLELTATGDPLRDTNTSLALATLATVLDMFVVLNFGVIMGSVANYLEDLKFPKRQLKVDQVFRKRQLKEDHIGNKKKTFFLKEDQKEDFCTFV